MKEKQNKASEQTNETEQNKASNQLKDLKNIASFEKDKLATWGIIGALIIFAYSLFATIMLYAINSGVVWYLFGIIGLVLGIAYLVLGIFGIIAVYKKQENNKWGWFLAGSVLAILAPLAWYGIGGLVIAIAAGIMFLVYKNIK